ncbi:dolichol-phosphate mannosyltransferase [Tindallia magadiensis]|uniref:Dolichol-phosphate mannosyltransferase n=1 Tax=Tindallia magadiensis TaxID=69895 RepID=A0A1I3DWW8_9FIRM|nr:glycosyltransferase family 2 protein [Tindallia magadiensis]SFH91232.1 dolichol-phosphate mannosyltransferase [Tindallia magadiensis]
MKKPHISIVVPMYNESEVAETCYQRLKAVMEQYQEEFRHELIFVNDGSRDDTLSIIKALAKEDDCLRVINFARNFGHQIAVTAGIHRAAGDAVVVIDADMQDPPELIPEMVAQWKEGYHVVYGQRQKREGETWFKLATAKGFYRILNKMTEVVIPMDTGDFRLMDRKVVDVFKNMPERSRFIRGMVSWIGFKQKALLYERKERFAGESKYPLHKMLKLAADGILAFSGKPVEWIRNSGLVITGISKIMFFIWLILLILGDTSLLFYSGWHSVLGILIGTQLLAMGILGEYLLRVYDEVRNRPLYIIDEEIPAKKARTGPRDWEQKTFGKIDIEAD